jgi:hypothetical protein
MPDDNPIGPCNIVRDETQDPGMLTRSRSDGQSAG